MQLIYASRPFGFDATLLDDILVSARRHNAANGVTGALICRHDIFLQMLEGPRRKVTETFARILRDDRHIEVSLLWCGDAPFRSFPDWTMRDDPVQTWMWNRDEVREMVGAATAEDARQIFTRLAREPHSAVSQGSAAQPNMH
jgi:hypothetical protein